MEVFEKLIRGFFKQNSSARLARIEKINAGISKTKQRIDKAIQMMLDSDMDSEQYKEIKTKYDAENSTLLRERASLELDKVDVQSKVHGKFNLLKNVDTFYEAASVTVKQQILSLIFPEKLVFENDRVQTPKMNDVLSWIMLGNNELGGQKKETDEFFFISP